MSDIKILDCTLRDGGYINNWDFGFENSKKIISLLKKSSINYIETGFLSKEKTINSQTLYSSFDDLKKFLPQDFDKTKLVAMVKFGEFPVESVENYEKSPIEGIRVIFKKHQKNDALNYCRKIKEKGYKLFINPTFINQYSDFEYEELLKEALLINPYAFTLTDSTGTLKEKDINRLYNLIENNLADNINLCFHSHNNLQLSYSNAQHLIKICKRNLIIDSTVSGIGRGAGNLCSELILQFLNENHKTNYDISPVIEIAQKFINQIYLKTPWGYSIPYYYSAINHCHPNYAKFLAEKKYSFKEIGSILQKIPEDKKSGFDINFISELTNTTSKEAL